MRRRSALRTGPALRTPLGTLRVGVGEPARGHVRLPAARRGRPYVGHALGLPGGDLLEPQGQLQRAGTLLGVLGQTGPHQRGERVRDALQLGLLVHHPVEHHLGTAVPEGRVAHRGVRQRGAEREHVRRRSDRRPAHLLRSEEPGGADRGADVRERGGTGGPGDAEVDDPRPLRGQQDVGRLQVPVHHPGLVHGDQALGQRGAHGRDVGRDERTTVDDLVVQGGAGHVLRGEPGAVRLQVRGDQPRGAAAPDAPGRRDLAGEPRPELLVLGQVRPDDLQRDPLPLLVGAQVDHAHPARAQPPVKPERADDARVLAPQAHHRHVHPRCPVPVTCHSLRFHGRPRAEAAPSRDNGLSVPGARVEAGPAKAGPHRPGTAHFPNRPPRPGDWGGRRRGGASGRAGRRDTARLPRRGGRRGTRGGDGGAREEGRSERSHRTARRYPDTVGTPSGKTPRPVSRSPPRGVRGRPWLILREARHSVRGHDVGRSPGA